MSDADRVKELEAQLAAARAEQPDPPALSAVAATTDQDKPAFIVVKGERIRLPDDLGAVDIDTLEAFEQGKVATAIKGILGQDALSKIRSLHGGTLRVKDMEPIAEQIAKAYGFSSQGESAASSS